MTSIHRHALVRHSAARMYGLVNDVGPVDQYAALCAPDPLARLDVIDRLLDDVEAGLRFRLG